MGTATSTISRTPAAQNSAADPLPVFIVTGLGADPALLERLLDHHPEVHAGCDAPAIEPGAPDALRKTIESLVAGAVREASMSLRLAGRPPAPLQFVCAALAPSDQARWEPLLRDFAGARVLSLIRDGRDVIVEQRLASLRPTRHDGLSSAARSYALSAAAFHVGVPSPTQPRASGVPVSLFCPESLRAHTTRWIASLRTPLLAAELLGDRARIVRAEDLITDTIRAHASTCHWLGLAGDAAHIHRAVVSARPQLNAAAHPGLWRAFLSESDITGFKRMAGELLVELGYERGTDW